MHIYGFRLPAGVISISNKKKKTTTSQPTAGAKVKAIKAAGIGLGSGSVSASVPVSGTREACLSDERCAWLQPGLNRALLALTLSLYLYLYLLIFDSGYADCRLQFSMHNQQQQHFAT